MPNYNPADEALYQKQLEEVMLSMVEKAANAASKGENIEQLLEVMLASVNNSQKQFIRDQFFSALKKRKLPEPTGEADIPSRKTLARLKAIIAMSSQQAIAHIRELLKARPDIAERVKQAGYILQQSGVQLADSNIREEELGTLAPTNLGIAQTRKTGLGGVS